MEVIQEGNTFTIKGLDLYGLLIFRKGIKKEIKEIKALNNAKYDREIERQENQLRIIEASIEASKK